MNSPTRIVRIETQKVFIPFHQAAEWGAGKRPGTTRLIVQIHTVDGTVGVGETICLWEFVEPVVVHSIVPLALGEDALNIERLCKKIEGAGFYHHQRALVAALCGFEMALWDIVGKQAGLPLYQLWGGAYRTEIPLVGYVQSKQPAQAAADAAAFVAAGHQTIKAKIGMSPETDVAIVAAVRAAIGPDIRLRADVNGAWTIGTAKRMLRKLEPYDLEYVEQPLQMDDLRGHAELRKQFSTPIALDESAYTMQEVLNIIRAEAADVLLLDPHQTGGLSRCRKAAAIAEAAGLPIAFHSGAELGCSTAAYLHLAASLATVVLAMDSQYTNQCDEITTERHAIDRGCLRPPKQPGLGVTLDAGKLVQYRAEEIRDPYLDRDKPDWFPVKPQY
jgi:L-rhamnonate dehydratase